MDVYLNFFIFAIFKYQNAFLEEFCSSEIFQPKCSKNKIIYIENAIYGRKDFGKCVKKKQTSLKYIDDPSFIGCYSDVKH